MKQFLDHFTTLQELDAGAYIALGAVLTWFGMMLWAGLQLIPAKQKPDQDAVDKIHMVVLTALDAAKRGKCPNGLANTLSEHLMVGVLM